MSAVKRRAPSQAGALPLVSAAGAPPSTSAEAVGSVALAGASSSSGPAAKRSRREDLEPDLAIPPQATSSAALGGVGGLAASGGIPSGTSVPASALAQAAPVLVSRGAGPSGLLAPLWAAASWLTSRFADLIARRSPIVRVKVGDDGEYHPFAHHDSRVMSMNISDLLLALKTGSLFSVKLASVDLSACTVFVLRPLPPGQSEPAAVDEVPARACQLRGAMTIQDAAARAGSEPDELFVRVQLPTPAPG